MLDTFTLRVTFGLIALCVLVLCYAVTYRSTRSAYSFWWCLALICFMASAGLFLFNGTPMQAVANPVGNLLGVLGASCVWASARSLRGLAVASWQLAVMPVAALVAGVLDDPGSDVWAGGGVYLLGMAVLLGRSTWELVALLSDPAMLDGQRLRFALAVRSMAVVSAVVAVFYLARAVALATVGAEHPVFVAAFGAQVTTILTTILLVVVTFNMSSLSHEQQTSELRERATRDGLTGLLNRGEFVAVAERWVNEGRLGRDAAMLVCDLDRFKGVNDGFGHAAGDRALISFADACVATAGAQGAVGRLGGDEFAVLVAAARADDVIALVKQRFRADATNPTVSVGVARIGRGADLSLALARADDALYAAKAAGRDRVVWHDAEYLPPSEGRRAG